MILKIEVNKLLSPNPSHLIPQSWTQSLQYVTNPLTYEIDYKGMSNAEG